MPPTLAYVFRTIGIIEGLCRTFDPNFNFIEALKPYTKEWLIQSKSVGILEKLLTKAIDKTGFQGAEGLLEIARIPIKANKLLSQMENGDFSIPIDLKPLQNKIERIEEITQGIAFMLIGIILLAAGAICWQFLNALGLLFTVLSVSIAFTGMVFFLLGIKKIVFH
jgi:predicted unusual protein kinase regulating ubiquinone biosynthesis (AarF/ABC1/UbiB family)